MAHQKKNRVQNPIWDLISSDENAEEMWAKSSVRNQYHINVPTIEISRPGSDVHRTPSYLTFNSIRTKEGRYK